MNQPDCAPKVEPTHAERITACVTAFASAIKNITGGRYGGAIAAALFLAEYAGDGDWAHLDIAGPARWRETAGEYVKGGSGVGVRTLLEFATSLSETD